MGSNDREWATTAGIVARPHLYQILSSPLNRVCVLEGPSGSGKTTLLRSWMLTLPPQERPVWISLSPRMSRLAFWRHVANSARRLDALSRDGAVHVNAKLDAGVDPVLIAIEALEGAGPVTFVFDAYEHLDTVISAVDADLARLIAAVPELRILISTRRPTALSGLRVPNGFVRQIALPELALTPEEVGELLAAHAGVRDRQLAHRITRATAGFALTVRSIVLAIAHLGRAPRTETRDWDEIIAARFESLVPEAVPSWFVIQTSVAPYVDAALARELTGRDDAGDLLDLLERNGFGRWVPYGYQRPVFQYVETLRDTFRGRAGEDGERFARACRATARWLFEAGEVDQALHFAIDGDDYAFADRVFVSLVTTSPEPYTTDRFLPVLLRLDEEALTAYPMLAFGLGLSLMVSAAHRSDAPRVFQLVADSSATPSYLEPRVDEFSHRAMRAVALRLAGRYRDSAEASFHAAKTLDALPASLTRAYGDHLGVVLRQLTYSMLQGGRIKDAIAYARRSVMLCQNQVDRGYSVVYAACAAALSGDLPRAQAFLALVDEDVWPDMEQTSYLRQPGIIAHTLLLLDDMDFAGALTLLERTQTDLTATEFWPFVAVLSVLARHGLGQSRAVAEHVTRLLRNPPSPYTGDNLATEMLHAALARAWLAAGERAAAARVLDELPGDRVFLTAARTALLLAEGRDADAFAYARDLLAHPRHTPRTRADLATIGAVAALRTRAEAAAWSWLDSAAVTWQVSGPRTHVAQLSRQDRRLLVSLAAARGTELIRAYLDVPDTPSTASPVRLTPREKVVLRALTEHESTKAIAAALVVSPDTVKTQLRSLYRKLQVSSRTTAIAVARELGLLEEPPG